MTTQVVIDLNVRLGRTETFVGFEDVSGPVYVGAPVEVVEPESHLTGPGAVTRIDVQKRLVYLSVEWAELRREPDQAGNPTRADTGPCDVVWFGPGYEAVGLIAKDYTFGSAVAKQHLLTLSCIPASKAALYQSSRDLVGLSWDEGLETFQVPSDPYVVGVS